MAGVGGLVLLLSLAVSMAVTGAIQFRVGGSMDWAVPADPNAMSYNQWAEKNRFRIGDSLLFVYPPDQDSVLQVDKNAYNNCNTSSYIVKFAGGNTVFVFNTSGPFYFISGVEPNCIRNESMVVVVMAERSKPPSSPPSSLSPASSSSPSTPPGSSVEVPPSPTPPASSDEVPPSPAPPTSSDEVPPSSAPGGEASPPPPPNGASLKVVSFMGSVGAAVGMLLFVL